MIKKFCTLFYLLTSIIIFGSDKLPDHFRVPSAVVVAPTTSAEVTGNGQFTNSRGGTNKPKHHHQRSSMSFVVNPHLAGIPGGVRGLPSRVPNALDTHRGSFTAAALAVNTIDENVPGVVTQTPMGTNKVNAGEATSNHHQPHQSSVGVSATPKSGTARLSDGILKKKKGKSDSGTEEQWRWYHCICCCLGKKKVSKSYEGYHAVSASSSPRSDVRTTRASSVTSKNGKDDKKKEFEEL